VSTPKTLLTDDGAIALAIPHDRGGTFEPRLIPKNARRLLRFDQTVLSLYARGVSVREIVEHLAELYQVEVAPSLISAVTDEVPAAPVIQCRAGPAGVSGRPPNKHALI
jgi:putative transposase